MATQDELDKLWKLAGQLTEARKRQARSQTAYLARQKAAQDEANRSNWFAPTLGGAASGALAGFMAGGPMGAGIGALGGGAVGYLGRQQFNENPGSMQALGNTAVSLGAMSRMNDPVSGKAGKNGTYQQMAAGRGLSLTPDMTPPTYNDFQHGVTGYDVGFAQGLDLPALAPIPSGGGLNAGFPLETSAFDDIEAAGQTFQDLDLGGNQLQAPGDLMYQRQGPARLSATPGLFGEEDMVKASDYQKKKK